MLELLEIILRWIRRPTTRLRIEFPHLSLSASNNRGNPTLITDLPLSTLFRLGGQL